MGTRKRGRNEPKPHRFEVKVQDDVHVGGQRGEQGVEGPVGAHLGDDDGPQRHRQQHGPQGHRPAVTLTLGGVIGNGKQFVAASQHQILPPAVDRKGRERESSGGGNGNRKLGTVCTQLTVAGKSYSWTGIIG